MDYDSNDPTSVQIAKYRAYIKMHDTDFYMVDETDTTAVQLEKYREYLAQRVRYMAQAEHTLMDLVADYFKHTEGR